MGLKFKSAVYRYTGIFLAQKEEDAYIKSDLGKQEIEEIESYPDEDGILDGESFARAMWQARNGFYKYITSFWLKEPQWFYAPINVILVFFITLKHDLKNLWR
jgi:hypothetical protein